MKKTQEEINQFFAKTNRLAEFEAFCLVAELGSISRAAKQMGLTHSTISVKIKSLEEGMGVALLDRNGPHIKVTQAGDVFRETVKPLVVGIKAGLDNFKSSL